MNSWIIYSLGVVTLPLALILFVLLLMFWGKIKELFEKRKNKK